MAIRKHIKVVMIGVLDMERAVHFYKNILDLPLKFKTSSYSEFDTGGAILALEKRNETLSSGSSFTLESSSLKDDYELLKNRGVSFVEGMRVADFGLLALAYDNEGNIFEIVEYKKSSAQIDYP